MDELKQRKCAAKMVPQALTPAQRQHRVDLCQDFLTKSRQPGWLSTVLTADESWFYTENPHDKVRNMEWLPKCINRPQVAPRSRNACKVMLIAFFDMKGLVFRHWVLHGTVNAETYVFALRLLCLAIRNWCRKLWRTCLQQPYLLHDDNASAHIAYITQQYQERNGIEHVPHPAYSPDLAPCNFFCSLREETAVWQKL